MGGYYYCVVVIISLPSRLHSKETMIEGLFYSYSSFLPARIPSSSFRSPLLENEIWEVKGRRRRSSKDGTFTTCFRKKVSCFPLLDTQGRVLKSSFSSTKGANPLGKTKEFLRISEVQICTYVVHLPKGPSCVFQCHLVKSQGLHPGLPPHHGGP